MLLCLICLGCNGSDITGKIVAKVDEPAYQDYNHFRARYWLVVSYRHVPQLIEVSNDVYEQSKVGNIYGDGR